MKQTLFTAFATLALAVAIPAADFKGWISDASCGAGNAGSTQAARDCAERCIKGGAAPVFVTEKEQNVYKLTNTEIAKQIRMMKFRVSSNDLARAPAPCP